MERRLKALGYPNPENFEQRGDLKKLNSYLFGHFDCAGISSS